MVPPKNPKQHFVPKVYLKPFSVTSPLVGWPEDRPFTPFVWVIDRSLREEPVAKSPGRILCRRRIYTLDQEEGSQSFIEQKLSQLESEYAATIPRVTGLLPLSRRDLITLYIFVGALHGRTPSMMEYRQSQSDTLERMHRDVERGATGDEVVSDRFFKDSGQTAKRLILRSSSSYARLIAPFASIVVNRTPMPFVTSDEPVTHIFVHVDELLANGFPPERVRPDALPNERAFLSVTPLSPGMALISSPLLVPPEDSPYWEASDIRAAVALNEWTRQNAERYLISRYRNPYGPLREHAIALDMKAASVPQASGLQVYTDRARYWIPSDDVEDVLEVDPLAGKLRFTTADLDALHAAAADKELREINIYSDGEQVGGMRDAKFAVVATTASEASVIEMVL